MVLIIVAIIVVLVLIVGVVLYMRHKRTEAQRLQAEADAQAAAAAQAAAEAQAAAIAAEEARQKALAEQTAAAEAAAKKAAEEAAAAKAKADAEAAAAAAAQAAAAEAARREAAGIAAAEASRRNTYSYFTRGTGRDYVQGRSTPTAGIAGKGVLLGKFDTEEQCAAASLADKNTVGYGYFAPYNGPWSGGCVGILDKNPTYFPGVATHIYGLKRDPRDPAVVLRESGRNYAAGRVLSPTKPAIFETGVSKIYGRQPDEQACLLACYDDPACNAYTYHDAPDGTTEWAKVCVGTSERNPSFRPGGAGHKSGRVA